MPDGMFSPRGGTSRLMISAWPRLSLDGFMGKKAKFSTALIQNQISHCS